ncbi:MAG: rhomboid family intramembrane serine protease [Anaerolineales bacterium]|nr:rhomboid family intramembrane serine protease [Anaerolineales bacterium]
MIPINDTEPNRYSLFPFTTVILIAINTAILFWEMSLPELDVRLVFWFFGFRSSLVWAREGAGVISVITSTFLHADIFHLGGNMLFLWVFGRRVEDACGSARFLLFYLLAGTSAGLITALIQPDSPIPGIGASGAIFGVMGAYLILYPTGRIRTLWFLAFVPTWPRIRAFWFVFYYLLIQIPPALDIYLKQENGYGIGYWAHLGGFAVCIFIPLFLRPEAFARYISDVLV